MKKRAVILFTAILFTLGSIALQIYRLSDQYLAQAADQQGSVTLTVANSRGTIYDTNGIPLVNTSSEYRLSVTPTPETIAALSSELSEEDFRTLSEQLQSGKPTVVRVEQPTGSIDGSALFRVPVRYEEGSRLLAPHLLGYLDSDGLHGVTGVEEAFDDYLNSCGGKATVTYSVDAMGRPLQGMAPVVENTLDQCRAGVVLSIDADIQQIAEQAARKYIQRGAVVVMEPDTGRILAMVSLPDFQPDTVADSLTRADSPLLNRAMCNYNLGSVFKIVSTAAALEAGIPTNTCFSCTGMFSVGEVNFHCHNRLGHGTLNMTQGFAESCNPYFIQLMQRAGGSALYRMAASLGFDRAILLAERVKTARAILPSEVELQSPAAVANLSFGQGSLMGTPIHIAQMVAAVVNDGEVIRPTILKGYCDAQGVVTEEEPAAPQSAFSAVTAQTLRQMMITTVEEGTGKSAKPTVSAGGAGGKTGTAETGWASGEKEVVQSWFGGFYPSESPRYVISVIAEDSNNTGSKSSPVFKEICEDLYRLEKFRAGTWTEGSSSSGTEVINGTTTASVSTSTASVR